MPRKAKAPPEAEPAAENEQATLIEECQGLLGAGKAALASEIAFQKARATLAGKLVGRIAVLGVLALVLLYFILMALVVGSLQALAPVLGAWKALGVVVAALAGLIVVAVLVILVTLRVLKRVLKDKPE